MPGLPCKTRRREPWPLVPTCNTPAGSHGSWSQRAIFATGRHGPWCQRAIRPPGGMAPAPNMQYSPPGGNPVPPGTVAIGPMPADANWLAPSSPGSISPQGARRRRSGSPRPARGWRRSLRPPIRSRVSRRSGNPCCWRCGTARRPTSAAIMPTTIPARRRSNWPSGSASGPAWPTATSTASSRPGSSPPRQQRSRPRGAGR